MECLFLHGFFGTPGDWRGLNLEEELSLPCRYPHLFSSIDRVVPFELWAEKFNQTVEKGSILVGYSLGGRLALHAASLSPGLYRALVLISCHYGLEEPSLREARRRSDEAWADKILHSDWKSLADEWGGQPIFRNDPSPNPMREGDFSRKTLARAMSCWSLGRQHCLKEKVEKLSVPTLYIAGSDDEKFASLAGGLRFENPRSTIWIATESAHRVPWRQSKKFIERLKSFIESL